MVDYGSARAKYLESFVENIKWSEVSKRFGVAHRMLKLGPLDGGPAFYRSDGLS